MPAREKPPPGGVCSPDSGARCAMAMPGSPSGRCAPALGFRMRTEDEVSMRARRGLRDICHTNPRGLYLRPERVAKVLYYGPCALSATFGCLGAGSTCLVDEFGKAICEDCHDDMADRIEAREGKGALEEWFAINYVVHASSGLLSARKRRRTASCVVCGKLEKGRTVCEACVAGQAKTADLRERVEKRKHPAHKKELRKLNKARKAVCKEQSPVMCDPGPARARLEAEPEAEPRDASRGPGFGSVWTDAMKVPVRKTGKGWV